MESVLLNSKTALAKISRQGFYGEITEIEKIAEDIGVYGNVKGYSIDYKDNSALITFMLAKPQTKIDV
jgi:ABC-type uncharacterized transport system substrate-binding protein